jgi:hypothetical protein
VHRSMVGLLAAVGTAAAVLAGRVHGYVAFVFIATVAVAASSLTPFVSDPEKKVPVFYIGKKKFYAAICGERYLGFKLKVDFLQPF